MARFKVGDRVKVIITVGKYYDKCGTIRKLAQTQYFIPGECYSTPIWNVQLDNGTCVNISEKNLGHARR